MNKSWLIFLFVFLSGTIFSQSIDLRELRAFMDIEQKNYNRATDTISALIQEHPSAVLYLAKAKILYERDALQQALEFCDRANKLNPDIASELKLKIYLKDDYKAGVEESLTENLRSKDKISLFELLEDPDFAGIYTMELDQYILTGNFFSQTEKQIYQVERMIANKKNNQALFLLNEILSRNHKIAEAHYLKSKLLFVSGNSNQALDEISLALQLKSSNPDYLRHRIKINNELKAFDKALQDVEKLLRVESTQIQNYILKAQLLFKTEQYERAIKLTSALLEIKPNDPDLLYLRSKSYFMEEEYFEALKAINQSMQQKKSKEAYELRADIYAATETYTYAERDYSMFLDIEPYNGDIYAKKGFMRLKSGDRKGACSDWTKGTRYGSYQAQKYLDQYCQ
jgi:tetratricopeptide (TPR) repeat protein